MVVKWKVLNGLRGSATWSRAERLHVLRVSKNADVAWVDPGREEQRVSPVSTGSGRHISAVFGELRHVHLNVLHGKDALGCGAFSRRSGICLMMADQDAPSKNGQPESAGTEPETEPSDSSGDESRTDTSSSDLSKPPNKPESEPVAHGRRSRWRWRGRRMVLVPQVVAAAISAAVLAITSKRANMSALI